MPTYPCTEPGCKKKFKREQDVKMHWKKIHSIKVPFKLEDKPKRKYSKRKSGLTLEDAVIALTVKRDSFNEVLMILENLR
jgi:hypothetical protein